LIQKLGDLAAGLALPGVEIKCKPYDLDFARIAERLDNTVRHDVLALAGPQNLLWLTVRANQPPRHSKGAHASLPEPH
jgi:hypothetical protein